MKRRNRRGGAPRFYLYYEYDVVSRVVSSCTANIIRHGTGYSDDLIAGLSQDFFGAGLFSGEGKPSHTRNSSVARRNPVAPWS